ncbi:MULTISPECIES: gluconeogenesis factor YvcK family protein [Clostridium]|uniref:Putative gluconeogenesis factor n=2 Tax=Clostridium TaxID=1485 RepID=A0A151ALJ4_9CLOT|nr:MULTISPECIES: gluconeogenesis factor YvcK family protein [Clostridium]KYH28488.1 gluconeogenesis factor [Clostridium colicanis DSM 13634]MBE6042998.1 YvcK family protein [Clostridium thermopalmarium]PRR69093.1 Gluconeogenesis factor [Clostridium thermopalmarium DSM 5974]PVZ26556.1 putative cofD-like protein [Clostridium thermopalmarium DSM 5974]
MKVVQWLKPGVKVKRWIGLGAMGILFIVFAAVEFFNRSNVSREYKLFYGFLIVSGIFILYISINQGIRSIIALINKGYLSVSIDSTKLENLIYEKRLLVRGPKIVAIGGGTGLSTMLRGIKYYTSNITAIVTVGDDGGGSGALREELGILPPGDIRNCILALADTEPLMEELLQYRFKEGNLKNQSFGNLFLAAMDGISNNFEEAVKKMSSVLAVTGRVLPVTLDDMVLKARLENGNIVEGESNIPKEAIRQKSKIERMFIEPKTAKALNEALEAIMDADAIILGPGSLYTSVIPNLLVKDIRKALKDTKALKIYVSNIMTQEGETDGYSVADHIKAIFKHGGNGIIDYVATNTREINDSIRERYLEKNAEPVKINEKEIMDLNVKVVQGDFVTIKNGFARHDPDKLAKFLMEIIMDKKLLFDRKKIIEYFYLSQRLKENKKCKE